MAWGLARCIPHVHQRFSHAGRRGAVADDAHTAQLAGGAAGANNLTKVLRRVEQRPSSANAQEVPVQPLRNVDDGSVEVDEGTLAVLGFQTRGQEVDAVTRFVKQSVEQYGDACKPGDSPVAVLFRGKKSMALYEDQLSQVTLRDGRPLRVRAVGLSAMLDRPEVQDVLALLKVVGDHTDANALMRLLATPRYALGALDLKRLARRAADLNTEYRFRTLVEAGLARRHAEARMGRIGAAIRQECAEHGVPDRHAVARRCGSAAGSRRAER